MGHMWSLALNINHASLMVICKLEEYWPLVGR